jgi:hypothetical protein
MQWTLELCRDSKIAAERRCRCLNCSAVHITFRKGFSVLYDAPPSKVRIIGSRVSVPIGQHPASREQKGSRPGRIFRRCNQGVISEPVSLWDQYVSFAAYDIE